MVADQISSPLGAVSFSVKQIDSNNDGKNEQIDITITFKSTPSSVSSVGLLIGIGYELGDTLNV